MGPHAARHLYIEAVHRLDDLGAVLILVAHGTSQEGFDADWRLIELVRSKATSSADASCSTKQTSTPHSRGSTNSACRRRGWKTPRLGRGNDGRRTTAATGRPSLDNPGRPNVTTAAKACGPRSRSGPEKESSNAFRTFTEQLALRVETVAIRDLGSHSHTRAGRDSEAADQPVVVESLTVEVDDCRPGAQHRELRSRRHRRRLAELDARYLAGEAAEHAHTWAVVAGATPRSTGTKFPRQHRIG